LLYPNYILCSQNQELVQNADDNCYDATGEDPWLRLELHRGSAGSFFVSASRLKICGGYPLVNIQKTIEHGHRNSGFTH
jgi:hypothetical protein